MAEYWLRTFGGLVLQHGGSPAPILETQRKALALLAILAASGKTGIGRDRIMALLWPDADVGRARGSLNQTLHSIRRRLEHPEAVTGTVELRLDPGVIASDIVAFRTALAAGDDMGAVSLRRGPFLDAIWLDGNPEFEHWVDVTRAELDRGYREALERLATAAARSGDLTMAMAWWSRLVDADPLDGRVVLRAMKVAAAAGDVAGAVRTAQRHATRMQEALGLPAADPVRTYEAELRGGSHPGPPAAPPLATAGSPPARSSAPHEVLEALESLIAGRQAAPVGSARDQFTGSAAARELFRKGQYLYDTRQREGMLRALELYRQAANHDPTFAAAHAGIADVCSLVGVFGYAQPHAVFPEARVAAERAIALAPGLADGHAALGHLLFLYDWDWNGAAAAFARALALDPEYPAVRMYYASYLHCTGRSREGLTQLQAARDHDPLTPTGILRGRILVDLGWYDLAIQALKDELDLDPRRALAHQLLGHAYLQQGMAAEAIDAMGRAAELSGPRDQAQLAYVHAATGDGDRARQLLGDLVASDAPCRELGFHLGMAYGALGEADEAFRWLEAAREERGSFMVLLAVSTGFRSLRNDPRFTSLLDRIGLGGVRPAGGEAAGQ